MKQPPLAVSFAPAGIVLSDEEKRLFSTASPAGFILFKRNCEAPEQLAALVASLKETVGWDCPVMIDQEGGRVARLPSPAFPVWPAARDYGVMIENGQPDAEAVLHDEMRGMAFCLKSMGINVNCAPVLDVAEEGMTDAIGTRSYSANPDVVTRAGAQVIAAHLAEGVIPVIKHLPGHGRAKVDSHMELPLIDADIADLRARDFKPFIDCLDCFDRRMVWSMVAHLLIPSIDPVLPVSASPHFIAEYLRGEMEVEGLLLSDDIDMQALQMLGSIEERALKTIEAGCDIALYCHGKLDVMQSLAAIVPPMSEKSLERLKNSGFSSF